MRSVDHENVNSVLDYTGQCVDCIGTEFVRVAVGNIGDFLFDIHCCLARFESLWSAQSCCDKT